MERLRNRLSPAMVVASLALLVALGGTSVAAVSAIAPHSVGTLQLKSFSVGTLQLKANAVTAGKVKNGTLTRLDFAAGQLPAGSAGPAGPAGAVGPKGDKGDKGNNGDPGISGLQLVGGSVVGGAGNHVATVACPAGKKAIGGGYSTGGAPADLSITTDVVLSDGVTYRVDGRTASATAWNLVPTVYCATVP
jgi:hypothetical protein